MNKGCKRSGYRPDATFTISVSAFKPRIWLHILLGEENPYPRKSNIGYRTNVSESDTDTRDTNNAIFQKNLLLGIILKIDIPKNIFRNWPMIRHVRATLAPHRFGLPAWCWPEGGILVRPGLATAGEPILLPCIRSTGVANPGHLIIFLNFWLG